MKIKYKAIGETDDEIIYERTRYLKSGISQDNINIPKDFIQEIKEVIKKMKVEKLIRELSKNAPTEIYNQALDDILEVLNKKL